MMMATLKAPELIVEVAASTLSFDLGANSMRIAATAFASTSSFAPMKAISTGSCCEMASTFDCRRTIRACTAVRFFRASGSGPGH